MELNTGAIYTLPTAPLSGTFFRYIRSRYAQNPLSMEGSLENGGRYNVAGLFGALYLGFDRRTCEAEVSHGIAAGVPFKKGAFSVWDYTVQLRSVVRLDESTVQAQIGVTEADITIRGNHWTASGIGEHLHKRGDTEGLVAPSAQLAGRKCLDIYLDRVSAPSLVTPTNQLGTWP
jgi:RES domain-containing protein